MADAGYDVAVIGAGAAGMMCAGVAAQRGRRVVLIDHAARLAEKIRISGGGRCNFTNRSVGPENFISANPQFARSALATYAPAEFVALVNRYRIAWHEKHRGQLFCDDSSEQIIEMLREECERGGVHWRMPCSVAAVAREADGFRLDTTAGPLQATRVVIATGGLAIPQLGATDFGLKIARQFGLKVVDPRPALVPLTFDTEAWAPYAALAGVAIEAGVSAGQGKTRRQFVEDVLFTHRGLSGPGILQISSYWQPGEAIELDLASGADIGESLVRAKAGSRQQLSSVLSSVWPRRLADQWLGSSGSLRLADAPDRVLRDLGTRIHAWRLVPSGTAGFRKAEVMRGGIDTRELEQRSLESRKVPGLHFIGEVVDVTGWLGGYNFQWAWSSAVACARSL